MGVDGCDTGEMEVVPAGVNREVFDEMMSTGAVVAGRGTFELADGWGGDHHDGVPIFIVARHAPGIDISQWPLVSYVNDVASAMTQAREAADDKNVLVHGAGTARLAIGAGALDELELHLLTPQNAALAVIDYQPSQFAGVHSMDRDLLLENIVSTVKSAKAFDLPIVHSTINVATGRGQPTVPELAELLEDNPPIDRTTTNAWEDADFLAAVRATGRRKLILWALWTEICMAFPALDALREAYEVYPVVDAIGGTSYEAHRAGIERVVQAGAQPVTWVALAVELQRDWAREETVADVIEIVLTERLQKA